MNDTLTFMSRLHFELCMGPVFEIFEVVPLPPFILPI